jgi:hypothetical protein
MAQITVTRQADGTFRVKLPRRDQPPGEHACRVSRQPRLRSRRTRKLVRASFEFVLEREPATSILHEFSLDLISRYFPGYPAEIRARRRGDLGTPQ